MLVDLLFMYWLVGLQILAAYIMTNIGWRELFKHPIAAIALLAVTPTIWPLIMAHDFYTAHNKKGKLR